MPHKPPPPEKLGNGEGDNNRSPMGRFFRLARSLVNVPLAEVDEEKEKYDVKNTVTNSSESTKNGKNCGKASEDDAT